MRNFTHEDFNRHLETRGSSDRTFGFVIGIFLTLFALAPLRAHHGIRSWLLAPAILVMGIAVFRPQWLRLFNRLWTRLGLLLGRVVTPIVTGLLFFVVVTPIAFLLRRFGKDPLRLAPDRQAASYWIKRDPPGLPPETMVNQF